MTSKNRRTARGCAVRERPTGWQASLVVGFPEQVWGKGGGGRGGEAEPAGGGGAGREGGGGRGAGEGGGGGRTGKGAGGGRRGGGGALGGRKSGCIGGIH
ncbi:MAG: hypothetical protein IPQ12_00515 [Polaromonas sp.]|nr:hypothetical protein [Polaromonas sp.]